MTSDQQAPHPILLAGFEPFGGETVNPSWEAVRGLAGALIGGRTVAVACLPVEFEAAARRLRDLVDKTQPFLVLCVGQAGGRERISIERVAINIADARMPDNAGATPIDAPLAADGPAAYFATLPIKAMLAALHAARIPAEISQTAGTYVCNAAFYALMHALRDQPQVRAGFIHIPYSPEQAKQHPGAPSVALETVRQALSIMLDVALATTSDLAIAAGSEH